MNYKDINTIILVDDRDRTHTGGGIGSNDRQSRYAILFAVLKEDLKKLKKIYLILGDGTFEFDKKKNALLEIDGDQLFSDNADAQPIIEKIEKFAGKETTLLLIDYMLNQSTSKQEEGKQLACNILNSLESVKNVIRLLYSTSQEDKEAAKKFNWAYAFDFPIDSPTDAADTILQALKK